MRRIETNNRFISRVGILFSATALSALFLFSAPPPDAQCRKARKTHVVKSGDSIAKIADYYGVSQRDLREMNKLKKGKPLRMGQELLIPNVLRVSGKKYKVQKGDTLASIGQKFNRAPKDIALANKLDPNTALPVGRVLVIPDKENAERYKPNDGAPAAIQFLRVRTGEREKLTLYNKFGALNKSAVQRLSFLARDHKTNKVKRLNTRLIYLIQKMSDHFDGKPIEIISGYRAQSSGNESQHAFGRALDFRVPGVSTKSVYQYCRQLPRTGCGYYPNDGFVHMDAREKKTFWVSK
ncbi:MAG: LysM peptidoglycan-binding domain-containing protein [Deltaproteobacteria bacterium]|nr:LysM peptidoglycan-binding domain-containing protein [Deltaproteobacteria bacterium]MBN2674143.1 LysM peptidoglycan-binding domain-containing protein [Deltaproteobacteria bacterium]